MQSSRFRQVAHVANTSIVDSRVEAIHCNIGYSVTQAFNKMQALQSGHTSDGTWASAPTAAAAAATSWACDCDKSPGVHDLARNPRTPLKVDMQLAHCLVRL